MRGEGEMAIFPTELTYLLLTYYPALVIPQEGKCSGNIRDLLQQEARAEMQLRLGLELSPIAPAYILQRRPGNVTCGCTIYEAII